MFFIGGKILKEVKALRDEHDNLLHLITALAKEQGITVEIHKLPLCSDPVIRLVRHSDGHVQFHHISKEKANG